MSNYKIIAVLGAALLVGSVITYFVMKPLEASFEKCFVDAMRDQSTSYGLSAGIYCNQTAGITWLDWYHVFRYADYSVFSAFRFALEMKLKSPRERQKVLTQLNAYLRERQIRQGTEGRK
jgi:hypothetical protein